MYSGTTLTPLKRFDAWLGTHQKVDRVARRHLALLDMPGAALFPSAKQIIRFEGLDGPDGIKRKSPAKDEPWHYIDPFDSDDRKIAELIQEHFDNLSEALRVDNRARAAFEAAWMAHAIVDGLTPAHHYPYESELVKLRAGQSIETRSSPKEKLILPGETLSKQVGNNWKMWGDKGLLATHFAFEWGVAAIILPLRLRRGMPSAEDLAETEKMTIAEFFLARARQIAELHMYDQFYKAGWTPRLAKQVRRILAPTIVNTVAVAWCAALEQSREPAKETP